jgi:hypothetical protein
MTKRTQNSIETLENAVIQTILNNVNVAIRFYQKKPSLAMRISLEETIIENKTFAQLVSMQSADGEFLLKKLEQMHNDVIDQVQVSPIELPLDDQFFRSMEELLNEGKL